MRVERIPFSSAVGKFGTKSPRAFLDHLIFIQATSFLDLMDDVSVPAAVAPKIDMLFLLR